MMNLTTRYLGFILKNPLVVSANPLCEKIANIRKAKESVEIPIIASLNGVSDSG